MEIVNIDDPGLSEDTGTSSSFAETKKKTQSHTKEKENGDQKESKNELTKVVVGEDDSAIFKSFDDTTLSHTIDHKRRKRKRKLSDHLSYSNRNDYELIKKNALLTCEWPNNIIPRPNLAPAGVHSGGGGAAMPRARPKLKRKRYKGTQITICLTNCRYEVIRRVSSAFGMKEVSEEEDWNLYWTDLSVSVERGKEMKRFQRINHFPGMLEICRKDLLARNLNRMQKIYPKEYNFFPKTWCFPADFGDALNYSKTHRNKTFIIKPECGSQGRGIFLSKSLKDMRPSDRLICQVYLSKPYLVDGYKFDMRVYTLVTSCDPLRVFVFNEGLVRFATSRYADPNMSNTTNVFMHLTNYAVNKHSRTYVHDAEAGSKRKISTVNKILASQGIDLESLWHNIDQVIVKTIIAAWPVLKHSYHACFPSHDTMHACFELLGFDILIDQKLNPYILEVNHSPSFHTDTELDREVKESLLSDTMTMLNVWQCDKKRVLDEDRKRIQERLQGAIKVESSTEEKEVEKSPWLSQIQWEESHLGGFRRVYPQGDRYAHLFQQPSASIYTATASSRARGDCTKQQKEDFLQNKAKAEALILKPKALKEQNSETKKSDDNSSDKVKTKAPRIEKELRERTSNFKRAKENIDKNEEKLRNDRKQQGLLGAFEPEPIVEREEKERQNLMAQRDFLIRSYGLLEQIYIAMKRSGTLRPEDEKKYGTYGQMAFGHQNQNTTASKKSSNEVKIPKPRKKRRRSAASSTEREADICDMLALQSCVVMMHERPKKQESSSISPNWRRRTIFDSNQPFYLDRLVKNISRIDLT